MRSSRHASPAILVVEDDPEIRESLCDVLDAEGYTPEPASNGRDALARLAAMEPPRVILLDLMMPVMNGHDFLKALRADPRLATIPVIIVSAWPKSAAIVGAQAQGYVKKPIELDQLLEQVARLASTARI